MSFLGGADSRPAFPARPVMSMKHRKATAKRRVEDRMRQKVKARRRIYDQLRRNRNLVLLLRVMDRPTTSAEAGDCLDEETMRRINGPMRHSRKVCSCRCCGNPRRHWKERTRQERLARLRQREMEDELDF